MLQPSNNKKVNIDKKEIYLPDLAERKRLCAELYNKWVAQNPNPKKHTELPPAQVPASLANVDLSNKRMGQVLLDPLRKSVICGTVCSDSSLSIQRGYRNARINNRHSTVQYAWFFWKWMVCLREFHNGLDSIGLQNPDGHQKNTNVKEEVMNGKPFVGKLKLATTVNSVITELNTVLSANPEAETDPRKTIQRSWLNHMTNYFLMTIWLDDGGLMTNGCAGRINWNKTPPEQQKVFIDYLKSVWGVRCKCVDLRKKMRNGKNMHVIEFVSQAELLKFLRIVAPIIPVRDMLYKVQYVPLNDIDLLQRWASEVTNLVLPEFREEMKAFYDKTIAEYPLRNILEDDIVQ